MAPTLARQEDDSAGVEALAAWPRAPATGGSLDPLILALARALDRQDPDRTPDRLGRRAG